MPRIAEVPAQLLPAERISPESILWPRDDFQTLSNMKIKAMCSIDLALATGDSTAITQAEMTIEDIYERATEPRETAEIDITRIYMESFRTRAERRPRTKDIYTNLHYGTRELLAAHTDRGEPRDELRRSTAAQLVTLALLPEWYPSLYRERNAVAAFNHDCYKLNGDVTAKVPAKVMYKTASNLEKLDTRKIYPLHVAHLASQSLMKHDKWRKVLARHEPRLLSSNHNDRVRGAFAVLAWGLTAQIKDGPPLTVVQEFVNVVQKKLNGRVADFEARLWPDSDGASS